MDIVILIWLLIVILGITMIWPIVIGSVWLPTRIKTVRRMLEMAEVGPADTVYDLGSGYGRVVLEAAGRYGANAVGIEAEPSRMLLSRLMITLLGFRSKVKIIWGNFFHQRIGEATVVTLYLLQETNKKLIPKLLRELKPGTRVVSHVWTFEGWVPIKADTKADVYMYVIGQDDE